MPFYWVVDLRAEVVEVYSQLAPDPQAPAGWSCSITHRHQPGQKLAFAGRSVPVDDLL
jgi:hypothetical protein